jgi:hypothetical protein
LDPAFRRTGGDHKWLGIYLFPPLHSPFSDNRQTGYENASTAVFRMPCMPGPLHWTGRATCPGSCWASVRHWGRTQNFLVSNSTQEKQTRESWTVTLCMTWLECFPLLLLAKRLGDLRLINIITCHCYYLHVPYHTTRWKKHSNCDSLVFLLRVFHITPLLW